MATFITDVSSVIRNWPAASVASTTVAAEAALPDPSALAAMAADHLRGDHAGAKECARVVNDAIGGLLPSALAVALSPIPIVAVVVVLGAPRARTAGPAFALGWLAGLAAVSVVVVLVVGAGSDADNDEAGLDWLKIAIGIVFLLMAARYWTKRPKPGEEPEAPGWMATIDSAPPARAALLGAALSGANPKNLALTLTAAASIAEAELGSTDTAIAVAVFVALGSSTVAGAVVFRLVAGDRAARPLAAVKQFMADNNAVIMMVVLLLLGAKLLGDGLGDL
jgi:threonine/homoserine/homoserine lactone efflux protein